MVKPILAALCGSAAVVALAAMPASAVEITPTMKTVLQEEHLSPDILNGLDKELAVPQAWIDGAKKEGTVKVQMNTDPRDFAGVIKAFEERYPFVKIDYLRMTGRDRALIPLIAFQQGKYVSDVVYGFESMYVDYEKAGALADLRPLPAFASIPDDMKDLTGISAGYSLAYWCTVYNTDRLKEADLPKTWDDLITSKRLSNGAVGMSDKPYLWTINLWGKYGDGWLDKFMNGVFDELKPQLRKESMSALIKLTSLGEFDMGIPAYPEAVKFQADRGAKIGFHCPSPVPVAPNPIAILKGDPHPNAARLFVNWFLSKEGQIAGHHFAALIPAHKDLQGREFVLYPDTIVGKEKASLTTKVIEARPMLIDRWHKLWVKAGGPKSE